ncbi:MULTISPECIES: hypothetical protein [Microbacterium]|uniref:hypothetical protein n=1 Tax=Microbacterium TaxID=33882 RepID=UPI0018E2C6B8|nr:MULTISPECIES: hypothetical protein [Microbacterium]
MPVRPDRSWRRWFVVAPALAGLALVIVGMTLAARDADGFPAYLSVIVGGWALAFAAVNSLSALPPRRQWTLHVILAVCAIALLPTSMAVLDAIRGLPEPWRRPLFQAALGVPPAAGWVLVTLLGRVSSQIDRSASRRARAMATPAWGGADSRPELTVTASRLSPRRLTALIVGAVALGGALALTIVILAERWVLRLPPLMLVVLFGGLIALPLYAAVRALVNRRRSRLTVRWSTGAIEVHTAAGPPWMVPFAMIRRLVWCARGDMARLEIHTASRSETFLVGMVRQDAGAASELPPLQHRMTRALEHAGLRPRTRRDTARFDRAPEGRPSVSVADAQPTPG